METSNAIFSKLDENMTEYGILMVDLEISLKIKAWHEIHIILVLGADGQKGDMLILQLALIDGLSTAIGGCNCSQQFITYESRTYRER